MEGILFKPDMIKAITEGRKTQTRRVMQNQPVEMDKVYYKAFREDYGGRKPRYQVGEVVYIKEAIHRFNTEFASYDSDFTPVMFLLSANRFHWRWKRDKLSPMFLPYDAARYFIKITGVRAERLQEITPEDCVAEGYPLGEIPEGRDDKQMQISHLMRVGWYQTLWDSINPKYPWSSNPWCFVYTFRKVDKPVKGKTK